MEIFTKETAAALVAVIAGLGTYFLQIRWVALRHLRNTQRIVRRLLEAHSDAEAAFNYFDSLSEAVSIRGRLRLSSIVVERSVRESCERLARIDQRCVFEASEFLAALDVFEIGIRRLDLFIGQFVEHYPENGEVSKRHLYVRRLICGQAQVLKMDRLAALKAEIQLLNAMPKRTPDEFFAIAKKTIVLQKLKDRAELDKHLFTKQMSVLIQ